MDRNWKSYLILVKLVNIFEIIDFQKEISIVVRIFTVNENTKTEPSHRILNNKTD